MWRFYSFEVQFINAKLENILYLGVNFGFTVGAYGMGIAYFFILIPHIPFTCSVRFHCILCYVDKRRSVIEPAAFNSLLTMAN